MMDLLYLRTSSNWRVLSRRTKIGLLGRGVYLDRRTLLFEFTVCTVFCFDDDVDVFSIQIQYCSKEVGEDLLLGRHHEQLGGSCLGCVWCFLFGVLGCYIRHVRNFADSIR